MTSSVVSPWAFSCIQENPRLFCDVTNLVEAPIACGLSLQNLLCPQAGMFSRQLSLLCRENQIHAETIPRQTESHQLSCCTPRRKKWPWGRPSESWTGEGVLPGGSGLELVLLGVGLMIWSLNLPKWLTQTQQF